MLRSLVQSRLWAARATCGGMFCVPAEVLGTPTHGARVEGAGLLDTQLELRPGLQRPRAVHVRVQCLESMMIYVAFARTH